jgi:hypothetical protein
VYIGFTKSKHKTMSDKIKVIGAYFKCWNALSKKVRDVDLDNLEEEIEILSKVDKHGELGPEDLFLITKDRNIPVYILQGQNIIVKGKEFKIKELNGYEKFRI